MIIAVAIASIIAFLIAFWAANVVAAATRTISTAVSAVKVLSNSDIDDEAKEKASQKAALSLLGGVVSIVIRATVSIVVAAIPIYVAEAIGWVPAKDTITFLLRWDVIVITSVVLVVLLLVGRRLWPSK